MSSQIKTKDIVEYQLPELLNQLSELKAQLVSLRAKQQNVRAGEIKRVRKSIARVLTVYNLKRREEVRAASSPKSLPKDLRSKKTRALRRRLSPEDAKAKTVRQQKKLSAFPQRKYAIKA